MKFKFDFRLQQYVKYKKHRHRLHHVSPPGTLSNQSMCNLLKKIEMRNFFTLRLTLPVIAHTTIAGEHATLLTLQMISTWQPVSIGIYFPAP